MLEVIGINYNQNYFTVRATESGDYIINNLVCSVDEGIYQIHASYDFIRNIEAGTIVKAQIEAGKKKPVVEKKKKATKKTKKTLN